MNKFCRAFLTVCLLVSLLSAAVLLGCRFSAEWNDRAVLAVMSDEDVAALAAASGVEETVWRTMLAPAEGYLTEADPSSPLPLALIENRDRTGILPVENFDPETYPGPTVKAFYLYTKEYGRMAYLDDAQRIEDLLFRAVTDRGLRLLILTPMCDAEGTLVTDPAVWQEMLDGLRQRLEARGYTFGETFSYVEFDTPLSVDILRLLAGLLPLFLGCWLLLRLVPALRKPWLWPLAAVAYFAARMLLGSAFYPLLHLAAALAFSLCAAYFVAEYGKKSDEKPLWQTVLIFTAAFTGWSLLGGLWVSALMSTRTYLLDCAIFAGVKVSLLLPMAFGCGLLLWNLRQPLLRTGIKGWLGLAAVGAVLAAAALALALRSGDIAGGISKLETGFRNFLEYTLYVRPRTKEMLAAVPCIPLFLWACRRKFAPLQLLCGAGVMLECVSVINTFCHAVAPLQVSVMRTLLGVGLGILPGLLAAAVLEAVAKRRT
ncbi:MAG: hypothetical protein IKU58_09695 [Clostridia bacterium]|nr:hypothetical protein [Clostridia bacterium]